MVLKCYMDRRTHQHGFYIKHFLQNIFLQNIFYTENWVKSKKLSYQACHSFLLHQKISTIAVVCFSQSRSMGQTYICWEILKESLKISQRNQ